MDEEEELQNEPSVAFLERQLHAVMTMPPPGALHATPMHDPQLRS